MYPGAAQPRALVNDASYDVGFYHLDLEIAIDSSWVDGTVNYIVTALEDNLTSLRLDLDDAFTVDNVSGAASAVIFSNNEAGVAVLVVCCTNRSPFIEWQRWRVVRLMLPLLWHGSQQHIVTC